MKQGESKRKQPKDKHTKASWKKRDEGRKGKQQAYADKALAWVAAGADLMDGRQ